MYFVNYCSLDNKLADEIYAEALRHELSVIVEVHDNKEAETALKYEDALIGINNRNLKTLDVSINNTISIFEILKRQMDLLFQKVVLKMKPTLNISTKRLELKTFLIGRESLLKSDNPSDLLKRLIQITQ